MGERCNRTAEVRGSIPLGSTRFPQGAKNPTPRPQLLQPQCAAHLAPIHQLEVLLPGAIVRVVHGERAFGERADWAAPGREAIGAGDGIDRPALPGEAAPVGALGMASRWERVCQYVSTLGGGV